MSVATLELGDLLDKLESGKRPKGGVKGISEGIPSLGGEHLNSDGGFKTNKMRYVPFEFASNMDKGVIQQGDILVVKDGATTGKVSLVDNEFPYEKAVINEHLFICRPNKKINSNFLYFYLWSEEGKRQILKDFRGAAQGGISKSFVEKVKVPLFSLPKQQKIVEKIEELFTEIDSGVEDLRKSKLQLEGYVNSLLGSAFQGRLSTEADRSTIDLELKEIENSRTKNKRATQERKINKSNLENNWRWVQINDICLSVEYGSSKKSLNEGYIPVLRMGNLQNGEIDWTSLKYSVDPDEIAKYELREMDVLFNRTNSPEHVGKTAIYRGGRRAIFAGYLIRINLPDCINPEYVNYYLQSPFAKHYGSLIKTDGVNQSNINGQKLLSYPFPFTTRDHQDKLVELLNEKLRAAKEVSRNTDIKIADARSLKQSILAKAFKGELV